MAEVRHPQLHANPLAPQLGTGDAGEGHDHATSLRSGGYSPHTWR
jgi:hypothetical protein